MKSVSFSKIKVWTSSISLAKSSLLRALASDKMDNSSHNIPINKNQKGIALSINSLGLENWLKSAGCGFLWFFQKSTENKMFKAIIFGFRFNKMLIQFHLFFGFIFGFRMFKSTTWWNKNIAEVPHQQRHQNDPASVTRSLQDGQWSKMESAG